MARQDLGLTDDEWLSITPRQLFALRRRRISNMQWTELMFSRLTAAVVNFGFARPKTLVEETAFMLHPFRTIEPDASPGEAILKLLEALPAGSTYRI